VNSGQAKIVVLDGKFSGKTFILEKPLILGRHPEIEGRIPDGKVSREHSKVFRQGGDYYIVDLNSRNGTLVNDAPITRRLLRNGDEITLGETRLRFELEVAEPPAPAVQEKKPAVREVIDLEVKQKPPTAPAGALSADEIVVKDTALQFSKYVAGKKKNLLFDDLGQRSLLHQILMGLVVLLLAVGFLYVGLLLAGVVGGG
jgi:hypothetical protein